MFAIIGIVIVFGSIVAGYLMEHGKLMVLMQPAELLIILGAAVGTILIANPLPVVIQMLKGIAGVFSANQFSKAFYLENLKMLYEIFNYARKSGLAKLEGDVEEPQKSQIFLKYKNFLKNHHAVHFVCDTMRMAVTGGMGDFEIDQMMEQDIEVHHRELSTPVTALSTMADALPGLGIVAAVLGVVITMGAIGGPPAEIGHKVAAALVGTFLGILLCYGLFGPLSQMMAKTNDSEGEYYNVLRVALVTFIKGMPAIMAVETARRSIPSGVRPSFQEMEKNCKTANTAPGAATSAAPAAAAPAA